MRREQAAAVLAGTFLSLAAALAFVILPMCLLVGCYVVGTWLA